MRIAEGEGYLFGCFYTCAALVVGVEEVAIDEVGRYASPKDGGEGGGIELEEPRQGGLGQAGEDPEYGGKGENDGGPDAEDDSGLFEGQEDWGGEFGRFHVRVAILA